MLRTLRTLLTKPPSTASHQYLTSRLSQTPQFLSILRKMSSSTTTTTSPPPPNPLHKSLKIGLIQLLPTADKSRNLFQTKEKILEAAKRGADLIVLPECFNSPYGTDHFPEYAEDLMTDEGGKSESMEMLSSAAKETGKYLVGGSIPERDPSTGNLYNTSLTFNPNGKLIGKHRKTHLFDIDIPGKITFQESLVLSPGDQITTLDLPPFGKIAVAICYDLRFPEQALIPARRDGVFALIYPGAFNMTTGPLHWELLARSRAVDSQVYVAVCSPARTPDTVKEGYKAWGHSMVVDPNGEVLGQAGREEEIVIAELRPERIEEVRRGIPVTVQRRLDVYGDLTTLKK